MSWKTDAKKSMAGDFLRVQDGRTHFLEFLNEPEKRKIKLKDGTEKESYDFKVVYYGAAGAEGSPRMVMAQFEDIEPSGETKVLSVISMALLREIVDEDDVESVIGRVFAVHRTGTASSTRYKLREIRKTTQRSVSDVPDPTEEATDEELADEEPQPKTPAIEAAKEDFEKFKKRVAKRSKKPQ